MLDELRSLATRIEELAARYEKSKVDCPLHIDNQLSVEKGLLELRKLYTSGNAKLEKAKDERDFDASRKRMNDAATQ